MHTTKRSTPTANRKTQLNLECLEDRTLMSVTIASGFSGLAFDLSQGATPPDTQVAVGPTSIGEAVNTNLAFYNKSGGTLFQGSFGSLFGSVRADANDATILTDPSIHYDADNGRFIVSILDLDETTNTAYIDVAVSTNNHPAQATDFLATQINVTETAGSSSPNRGSKLWTDFDRFGSSSNAYVFTFNMFTFPIASTSLYDHVQVLAISKSAILGANPVFSTHKVDLSGWDGTKIVNENLSPVDMHGAQATDPMYFVEETTYGAATNTQLRILKVANIMTATASSFQVFDVTVPTYTTNPLVDSAHPWNSGDTNANAPQLGSSDQMQTNDTRVLSAAWRRDSQGVEHLVCSQIVGATLARARWYEFLTSTSTPSLHQSGDVGAAGAATYFPSIDIAPNGNIAMDYIESSSIEYMSMYVTGRTTSDALGTMETPVLAQAGQGSYNLLLLEASPHRAGDFSGIGLDIDSSGNVLNDFWGANEFTGAGGGWATWISNFTAASLPVVLDNGQPGYAESGSGWTDWAAGYNGGLRFHAPGGGADTASWQTTGLAPGYYNVQATWNASSNHASNSPYSIYDGNTLIETVVVDQRAAPSGGATVNGVVFQNLGTVQITSGTLRVVLSDNVDGYVVADAVLVSAAPTPTTDLNWSGGGISGPTTASAQSPFTVSRTYTVSGSPAGSSFTIAYYASTDTNFAHAVLLGTETIGAAADLALGSHTGTSPGFTIATGGTYYLFALLDASGSIVETNPNNDLTQATQPVLVSGPVIVVNGQAGYSETGTGWTSYAAGYAGTLRFHAPGTGADTAVWQATGLPAGYYTIQATWNGSSNHATNAPYAIYDGNTLLQTVVVNQQSAPSGSTTLNGVVFQDLASVKITSGTIRVVLSDNVNGYVVADTVRFAPIAAPVDDLNWSGGGIIAQATATTQTTFTVNRSYNITGASVTPNFTISYYASTDTNFADAVLIGSETISAGTDKTVGLHTGVSPTLQITAGGTYYVFAMVNSSNTVLETDPTNDVTQAPQALVVTVPVIVDNGQPGYSETGSGWTDWAAGYNGGLRFHAPGSGADTASWQVTGLASGYYTVQATWNGSANHASNAPYSIYDGNTLLLTVTANQQPNPSGFTFGGVVFQDLATVQITSGTLRVVLSDNVNGYVVADAVRIVPVPALTVTGPVLLDNGQPGYSESGPNAWTDYATGYNGGLRYHGPGGGADTATWLATGLPAGTYMVEATWNASSNHPSDAPYSIYDGNTLLQTVLVDQRPSPSGTTLGGVVFQTLATVQVTSGSLRVVLSDNVDGYVVADAVLVVPVVNSAGKLAGGTGAPGTAATSKPAPQDPPNTWFWREAGRRQADLAHWWFAQWFANDDNHKVHWRIPLAGDPTDKAFAGWA
jgi:hypothetical protein